MSEVESRLTGRRTPRRWRPRGGQMEVEASAIGLGNYELTYSFNIHG